MSRNLDFQAFPTEVGYGLTARDIFAGQVAAAMVSTITTDEGYYRLRQQADNAGVGLAEWIAMESFKQANAMMVERQK